MVAGSRNSNDVLGDSFGRFTDLSPELRNQIWRYALEDAVLGRMVRLTVYRLLYVVNHTCLIADGRFCGDHGKCDGFGNFRGVSQASMCMPDGYFAVSDQYPEPEDPESASRLASLNLACYESRSAVIQRYPDVLRVYRGEWKTGVKVRLVRFNTEIDVLHLIGVLDMPVFHPHSGLPKDDSLYKIIQDDNQRFPWNASHFQSFRDLVASTQHVAFTHMGQRGDIVYGSGSDLAVKEDFVTFLFFFESLQHLYMWPDPAMWPEVLENTVIMDNIQDVLHSDDRDLKWLLDDAKLLLGEYHRRSIIQNTQYTGSTEHWVPRPKPLEKIGCYAPASWSPSRN
ncbi:hypothetical protein G7Z17_g3578 [Cylindrodendrum hubeiense]|uniref:2EXR domain-containing protein n=1 Tax=Cylindrodendrum hubeiense TaxID=595255 RepID=A0A9P5LJT7_9HYPO|nr:hypothetical protein G7Z17_g3578 [Cylindrodendrum hubeiense]